MKFQKRIDVFLKEYGMSYLIGIDISAFTYVIFSICAGVFVVFVECTIGMEVIYWHVISFVAGIFLPTVFLIISNESDNEAMLEDIKLIYEMLKIQIHAGVYIIDALENCSQVIKHKRLKNALNRMLNEIFMSRNVNDALNDFNGSFRNKHIETLVIILKQSMESGYTINNLDSAFEQVIDVERSINIKMENSVERNAQVLQVLLMAGIIAISIYCSIVEFKGLFTFF